MTLIIRPRARIRVERDVTTKTHATTEAAEAEAAWYRLVPWAAPRLLGVEGLVLTVETLPTAASLPGWRPAASLRALLERLHGHGIHHRDVHVRNVVRGPGGPLLIDWETAIHWPADLSYDLHGPASGVPVPEIHAGHTPQWWGSPQRASIASRWRA